MTHIEGVDVRYMDENLTERQRNLVNLLGNYYSFRIQNEHIPELEDKLVILLQGHKV